MSVQLRVALPRRAMHEPGHHQPPVATRRRTPPTCTRATAARSSKNPIAAATASRWAAATTSATGSEPNAHSTDTLFGRRKRQIERPHPTGP